MATKPPREPRTLNHAKLKHAQRITHRKADGKFKPPPGANNNIGNASAPSPGYVPDVASDYASEFEEQPSWGNNDPGV